MAQLLQFRCPVCLKLLFKFDKETGKVEYHISQFDFEADEKGNTKYATCSKCKTELEIMKNGLKKRELVEA